MAQVSFINILPGGHIDSSGNIPEEHLHLQGLQPPLPAVSPFRTGTVARQVRSGPTQMYLLDNVTWQQIRLDGPEKWIYDSVTNTMQPKTLVAIWLTGATVVEIVEYQAYQVTLGDVVTVSTEPPGVPVALNTVPLSGTQFIADVEGVAVLSVPQPNAQYFHLSRIWLSVVPPGGARSSQEEALRHFGLLEPKEEKDGQDK